MNGNSKLLCVTGVSLCAIYTAVLVSVQHQNVELFDLCRFVENCGCRGCYCCYQEETNASLKAQALFRNYIRVLS